MVNERGVEDDGKEEEEDKEGGRKKKKEGVVWFFPRFERRGGGLQKGGDKLGYESEAFAIYDTMRYIKPPIHTLCVGNAFGEAAFLLSAGVPVRAPLSPPPRRRVCIRVSGRPPSCCPLAFLYELLPFPLGVIGFGSGFPCCPQACLQMPCLGSIWFTLELRQRPLRPPLKAPYCRSEIPLLQRVGITFPSLSFSKIW